MKKGKKLFTLLVAALLVCLLPMTAFAATWDDVDSEAKLQAAMRARLRDTTVIMIAQRIASVRNADRIAVIENGTIKDCAPHDELMKISATYRDIYDSQMQSNDPDIKEVVTNE